MAKLSADATLFGLDLSRAWAHLCQLGSSLPLLRWLQRAIPATPVALVQAGGPQPQAAGPRQVLLRTGSWLGEAAGEPAAPGKKAARFSALLLPEDLILTRSFTLPPMSPADLAAAMQLQVLTHTPFAEQDTYSAYSARPDPATQQLHVQLVLASRPTIEQLLQRVVDSQRLPQPPEVWAPTAQGPILCTGWGERPRLRHERLQRWRLLASALLVLGLLLALVLTPSLKLRQQALQAQQQTQALVRQTTEVAAQRQAFMAQVQTLGTLAPQLTQQIDPLKLLLTITRLLPDDTAVQSLTLEGNRLSLQGLSDNASRVHELLSREPGFRNVRLPSAITREGRSNKESFVLEAELDPSTFTLWQLPQGSSAPSTTAP